jgi:hypothetical protein
MYQIKINSTTGSEIISNSDVKLFSRIDTSADNALISDMIVEARIYAENLISSDIVAKNRTLYVSEVLDRLELPFSPISSVSSITVNGTSATFTAYGIDSQFVELDSLPAKEVKITYITAGQSDGLLKQALLQIVSTYYDNRAEFKTGTIVTEIPTDARKILSGYKRTFI